jgi:hypothetical protein
MMGKKLVACCQSLGDKVEGRQFFFFLAECRAGLNGYSVYVMGRALVCREIESCECREATQSRGLVSL